MNPTSPDQRYKISFLLNEDSETIPINHEKLNFYNILCKANKDETLVNTDSAKHTSALAEKILTVNKIREQRLYGTPFTEQTIGILPKKTIEKSGKKPFWKTYQPKKEFRSVEKSIQTSTDSKNKRKFFLPDDLSPVDTQAFNETVKSRRKENIVTKGKEAIQMMLAGNYESAKKNYDIILSLGSPLPDVFSHWINYTSVLFHVNEEESALKILEQIEKTYSKMTLNLDISYCLGRIYMEKGQYETALPYAYYCFVKLDECTDSTINKFIFCRQYGFLSAKCNNYQTALDVLTQAYRLKSNDVMTLSWLGEVCIKLNKMTEANDYFEKALKVTEDTDTLTYRHYAPALLAYKNEKNHQQLRIQI